MILLLTQVILLISNDCMASQNSADSNKPVQLVLRDLPPPTSQPKPPSPSTVSNPFSLDNYVGLLRGMEMICQDAHHYVIMNDTSELQSAIGHAQKKKDVCKFPVNTLNLILKDSKEIERATSIAEISWFCKLSPNKFCDGTSHCLTDECDCETRQLDLFLCPDHSGCINFKQLCDGHSDCYDSTDECLCEGFVKIDCPTINSSICISERKYCFLKESHHFDHLDDICAFENAENRNCSTDYENLINRTPLVECIDRGLEHFSSPTNLSFSEFCDQNCTDIPKFVVHKWNELCTRIIRVVATTPRKDPQPNISDLRDRSQSIFRPILTRIQKKKKKKKKLPPYLDPLNGPY